LAKRTLYSPSNFEIPATVNNLSVAILNTSMCVFSFGAYLLCMFQLYNSFG